MASGLRREAQRATPLSVVNRDLQSRPLASGWRINLGRGAPPINSSVVATLTRLDQVFLVHGSSLHRETDGVVASVPAMAGACSWTQRCAFESSLAADGRRSLWMKP